jgi:hypothetical protein
MRPGKQGGTPGFEMAVKQDLGGTPPSPGQSILLGKITQRRPGTDPGGLGPKGRRDRTRIQLNEGRPEGRGPRMLTDGRIH